MKDSIRFISEKLTYIITNEWTICVEDSKYHYQDGVLVHLPCFSNLAEFLPFLLFSQLGRCYSGICATIPVYILYVCSFDSTWGPVIAEFSFLFVLPSATYSTFSVITLKKIFFSLWHMLILNTCEI